MVPLSLWHSRRSGALAEHCIDTRHLHPVVWVVGSVPVRTVLKPAPTKTTDNHANHDYVQATYAMFETGSCPACATLARLRDSGGT